jgi:hypothetical protein
VQWLITYILIACSLILLLDVARRVLNLRFLLTEPTTFIEITPPVSTTKSPLATQQLYNTLYTIALGSGLRNRLLGRLGTIPLEAVSTPTDGIRFIMRCNTELQPVIEQQIRSYLPNAVITETNDYLTRELLSQPITVMEFKLANHYAYSLSTHESLGQHDPVAYSNSALSNLKPGELVALQFILQPMVGREVTRIRNRLLLGKNPELQGHSRSFIMQLLFVLLYLPIGALQILLGWIAIIFEPTYEPPSRTKQPVPQRQVTSGIQLQESGYEAKLSQPLFQTTIRAVIISQNPTSHVQRQQSIVAALGSFNKPGEQYIIRKRRFPNKLKLPYRLYGFVHRLPAPFTRFAAILSVSEISSMYHFPYGDTALTENSAKAFSKTLPAPVLMKQHAEQQDFAVILGENRHHGTDTKIGLTASERERHVYLIGGTGNGKTTMLEYALVQDIQAGRGVAVIDPHGDLAQKLLSYIPKERMKDVIYLNPRDLDMPIGLNLIEVKAGLTGSELAHEKDIVTEAAISVFRKIFDDGQAGSAYRIERVLRNAIHTAFTVEGATLFTVLRLMNEAAYRKRIVKNLKDDSLKRFWKEELGKAGEFQRVKITSGPVSRIERFERSESAKRMLGQPKSTISFDDILDSSKILICNFAKGRLGEDTSTLFGTTVLAKLQLAAWRRDAIPVEKRVPFYLYVDEFQNFATDSFLSLFAEARKYKLSLTMAQQSVSQLSDQKMVNNILDNVGTLVVFRSKSLFTEQVVLHQLKPFVDEGAIANLDSFHFIMKVAAVKTQEPFTGETTVLDAPVGAAGADKVIATSRKKWGREYIEQEEEKPSSGSQSLPK